MESPPRRGPAEKSSLRLRADGRGPFRAWLSSLSSDASSALAAAETYAMLEPHDRDAWLCALDEDADALGPDEGSSRAAAYAPLLLHEQDVERRARIVAAIAACPIEQRSRPIRAWMTKGHDDRQESIIVIARPLIFDLDEMLDCTFVAGSHVVRASYVALCGEKEVSEKVAEINANCMLFACDPDEVVDALAHAIVSHGRVSHGGVSHGGVSHGGVSHGGVGPLPLDLAACAHLFSFAPLSRAGAVA